MSHPYAGVISTGGYLPEHTLSNDELAKRVDTSDEWIMQRAGIKSRHIIADAQAPIDLAEHAAREALSRGDVAIDRIDMIIVATASHDHFFPSLACQLQARLGATVNMPAFDLSAACSGFIYALSTAEQFIKSGFCETILIVGVDALSRLVDWTDRSTCVLFGDGAGAMVLRKQDKPGVIKTTLHANGHKADKLYAGNAISPKHRASCIQMDGHEIFRFAVSKLASLMGSLLDGTGLHEDDIDWLVPHQANIRIIEAAAKRLGVGMDKVILTLKDQGNTSAASIPLAFHHGVMQGQLQRGDLIACEAVGAGLTWGAALLRY